MLSQLSYITYMKMELLIYFLKLKIKESKEIKILEAIQDFWTMFASQEHAAGAGNVSGAGSRTGLVMQSCLGNIST